MITSKQNALIKEIRSLSDKKFRDKLNLYVVEGVKPINEAIELSLPVRAVIFTEKAAGSLNLNGVRAELVSDEVFKSVSEEVTPQGALAIIEKPIDEPKEPKGNCLLLDGVSDPANVGAIIRSAAAAGFNDVYLTLECADAYSQKAVRASMSCVFRVNVMRGELNKLLSVINRPLVVADMDGVSVFDYKKQGELCLVIGNEGHGVSDEVMEKSSVKVLIPMENGVESLNAAVSAGILMYALK